MNESVLISWLIVIGIFLLLILIASGIFWLVAKDDLKTYLRQLRKKPVRTIIATICVLILVNILLQLFLHKPFLSIGVLGAIFAGMNLVSAHFSSWWYRTRELNDAELRRIDTELIQEARRNGIRLRVRQAHGENSGGEEKTNAMAVGPLSRKYIFFDAGVFSHMDNDAELSSIVAHELTHHEHNDSLQLTVGVTVCFACLTAVGYGFSALFGTDAILIEIDFIGWIRVVILLFGVFYFGGLKLKRRQENRADCGAVERMGDLELVKEALSSFLISSEGGPIRDFFSTHPSLQKRIDHLDDEFNQN